MSKWIPVLVRLEDLEAVTRFLADLETGRNDNHGFDSLVELTTAEVSEAALAGQSPELAARPSWSLEDLQRLAMGATATTARWARAMDVCAEQPGTYFPTSEIAQRAGMTIAEWRDAPRKISRHLKAHFPNVPRHKNNDAIWPLHAKSVPEHPGEVSWAITTEMAELWKQVRGAQA